MRFALVLTILALAACLVAWVVLLSSVAGGLSMYWSHQGQLQRAQEEAAEREEDARIEAAVASARLEERLRLEAKEREQQAALEATRLERWLRSPGHSGPFVGPRGA